MWYPVHACHDARSESIERFPAPATVSRVEIPENFYDSLSPFIENDSMIRLGFATLVHTERRLMLQN